MGLKIQSLGLVRSPANMAGATTSRSKAFATLGAEYILALYTSATADADTPSALGIEVSNLDDTAGAEDFASATFTPSGIWSAVGTGTLATNKGGNWILFSFGAAIPGLGSRVGCTWRYGRILFTTVNAVDMLGASAWALGGNEQHSIFGNQRVVNCTLVSGALTVVSGSLDGIDLGAMVTNNANLVGGVFSCATRLTSKSIALTCDAASGDVLVTSAALFDPVFIGAAVSGTGITSGTRVKGKEGTSRLFLDKPTTAAIVAGSLTFETNTRGTLVPSPGDFAAGNVTFVW